MLASIRVLSFVVIFIGNIGYEILLKNLSSFLPSIFRLSTH